VTELAQALQELDLVVGRIAGVEPHPGARAPSYLLRLDLGGRGEREASVEAGGYEPDELEGAQIVCALRGEDVIVLAARSHAHGSVLLRPEREVEDGTVVG
jgi:tRNA-binding EMAP/Myf-like protein